MTLLAERHPEEIDGALATCASRLAARVPAADPAPVRQRPRAARRLVRTAGAAADPRDRRTIAETVVNALWYSVHATADLAVRLGGNPYDNTTRRYSGSRDDRRLNRRVRRIRASRRALANLAAYQPSGAPRIPVLALHTTRDEVVPVSHLVSYAGRAAAAGSARLLETRAVRRYGQRRFSTTELLRPFAGLAERARSGG